MTVTLNSEAIRLINFFENITGAKVKDCIVDEESNTIYFLIKEGDIGLAIGKNGSSVKNAEKILKRRIKLIEFSEDIHSFVRNTVPKASDILIKNGDKTIVEIRVEKNDKASVIGRDRKRLKIIREILKRNYNIDEICIR